MRKPPDFVGTTTKDTSTETPSVELDPLQVIGREQRPSPLKDYNSICTFNAGTTCKLLSRAGQPPSSFARLVYNFHGPG